MRGSAKASALSCVKISFLNHHDPFFKKKSEMGLVYMTGVEWFLLSAAVQEEKAMPILVNLKTPEFQESTTQGPPCR